MTRAHKVRLWSFHDAIARRVRLLQDSLLVTLANTFSSTLKAQLVTMVKRINTAFIIRIM